MTLHLECTPPTGSRLLDMLTSDIVVLSVLLADMTRTELALIDATTNLRRFSEELRWSQAHYRLAHRT